MNAITLSLGVVIAILVLTCHAWFVRNRFAKQLEQALAKHLRYKQDSEELLVSAKQQIANLKHQLAGARLEVKRAERHRSATPAVPSTRPSAANESLLLMLDEESNARHSRYSSGFADTTIKY